MAAQQRPHLAQLVIDDPPDAIEPNGAINLLDPLRRQRRLLTKYVGGAAARNAARIVLRLIPVRRASSLSRNGADEVLPAQLSPALHVQQPMTPFRTR